MKRYITYILIILAGVFLSASAQAQQTKISAKQLLHMVNKIRAEGCNCGNKYYPPAPPVKWDKKLETAAQKHSWYMYQNKDMTHYGPNKNRPGDRIRKEGYQWRLYGENVAHGYDDEESVVKGWLRSSGHCKNIMNPTVKHMGVARVNSYWTQVFANPR